MALQGKTFQGTAEVLSDEAERVAEALLAFARKHSGTARAYGVKLDSTGQPDLESARQAALRFKLVRTHLA